MVQRDPSPRGDKNGADINLALDALEMAFTHDHINAFAIVSGDSDFIALVNKLKQYDKTVFVVGGKAFTSTILQKNCHEFISYESMLDDSRRRVRTAIIHAAAAAAQRWRTGRTRTALRGPGSRRDQSARSRVRSEQGRQQPAAALDLHQAMPLVERALQVLERREVRPQLGLLKSTMLQLDSSFSERAYGAGSFTDFIEKLRKADLILVTGGEGRYMISAQARRRAGKDGAAGRGAAAPARRAGKSSPGNGRGRHRRRSCRSGLREESPNFDWKDYGFQEFSEFLNFAQDKTVVRIEPDEETESLMVYLGAEFHPPAIPEPDPLRFRKWNGRGIEEPQPVVPGQPTAGSPRVKKGGRKAAGGKRMAMWWRRRSAPARRPRPGNAGPPPRRPSSTRLDSEPRP